jgi:hypothetical protein
MKQFCSVCKNHFDMEVVEEGGEDEVTWLKCPRCKGILPYMQLAADDGDTDDEDKFTAESIDESEVVEYESWRIYEVGNIIYHRSWNDYGKVTEKLMLPGDRQAVRVQFLNQGDVNLLENVPAET